MKREDERLLAVEERLRRQPELLFRWCPKCKREVLQAKVYDNQFECVLCGKDNHTTQEVVLEGTWTEK